MAVFEPTIKRCVEWLSRHPDGCDTTEVSQGLGLTYPHVSGALSLAAERGELRWVHAPFGKAHNRRVYFTPAACPKCWGEASRKPPPAKMGKGLNGWKKAERLAKAARVVARTAEIVTIPHKADLRFAPTAVEPFFSRPGYRPDCIGQETWAAKVYA